MLRTKLLFGLALVVCAFTASVATSSASEFRAFKGATEIKGTAVSGTLTGSGEQKFTIGSGVAVVCTGLSGSGKNVLPSVHVIFLFAYTGCKSKVNGVGVATTVTSTGCSYLFDVIFLVSVECGTGSIVIEAGSLCTIKVPTQAELSKITYSPVETKTTELKGTAAVTAIKQSNSCGITGEVSYNGVAVIKPEAGVELEVK